MPDTVRHSLERRLFITLGITAVLFSVIAGGADYVRTYTNELERTRTTLDNLAATVRSSAAIAAFVNNDPIGTDVVDGLLRNDIILAAGIEGDRGYRLLHWREGIPQQWQDEYALSYPLDSPAEPNARIGSLKILTHADLITQRARNAAMQQMAILVLQTVLIAVVMLIGFRRFVGRPLTGLARQLVNTQPGSSQRVRVAKVHQESEIGVLASSVNSYLEASEKAILAERELRERVETMESHYRRIFESTRVGVMVLDMYGGLINCNAMLSEIANHSADAQPEVSFDRPVDFIPRIFKHAERAWALIERARTDQQIASGDLEIVEYDGKQHWSHCLFSLQQFPENDLYYIEAVLYDVTSRRKREEDALNNAERDPLTKLANRLAAETWLSRNLQDADAAGRTVTVFYMDLDGFKQVNDQYGHAAGDTVLVEVAKRLAQVRRRSSDLLARLGGDEFLLAAYGLDKRHPASHMLAEAILQSMRMPIALAGSIHVSIGISIGLASHPGNGSDCNTLLAAADAAMYEAKHQGKNRIVAAADLPEWTGRTGD